MKKYILFFEFFKFAFVAQLDRALPSEGKGYGFESRQVHHNPLLRSHQQYSITSIISHHQYQQYKKIKKHQYSYKLY